MSTNPYEASQTTQSPPDSQLPRGLIRAGVVLLVLAGICLAATIVGMLMAYADIAGSGSAGVKPSQLAHNISNALIPAIISAPLGLIGVVLLVTGFAVRRRHSPEANKAPPSAD